MRYQVTTLVTLRYFSTQVSGKPVQLVGQIKSLEYILDNSYTVMKCDIIVVGMKHSGLFGSGRGRGRGRECLFCYHQSIHLLRKHLHKRDQVSR